MYNNNHVLFVDDEKKVLNALRRSLRNTDYKCVFVDSASEAIKILETQEIAIVVADIGMPNMGGVQLLKLVEADYPKVIRVALTGIQDLNEIFDIFNEVDLYKYITKPWDNNILKQVIEEGMETYIAQSTHK